MAEKFADQTCSVCLEQFREPKILPCCHTFCLKCLEKIVKKEKEEEHEEEQEVRMAEEEEEEVAVDVEKEEWKQVKEDKEVKEVWEEEPPREPLPPEVVREEEPPREPSKEVWVGEAPEEKWEWEKEKVREEENVLVEKEINCPQCHKTHAIPPSGLGDFVTDFVVVHEIEESSLANKAPVCGECEGEGPVDSYCCDCQAYLCSECSTQAHKKFRSYRGHKVIPVQDLDVASLQSSKAHYCSTHNNEVVKLYCETCSVLVCRECYLVDHHQHSYKIAQDARKQLNDRLMPLVKDGKQKLASFKANLREIQKVEMSAARYPEVVKAEINTFFDNVIQSTEKRRQQLLAQADTACHKDLKLIWADKVFHQATISEAEDALWLADKATKCASDVEMILIALLSIRQLSRLQAIQWDASTFNRVVPSPVEFMETDLRVEEAGRFEKLMPHNNVEVQGLPATVALGKTVTFKVVPTLVDRRTQEMVYLRMKTEVIVKYGDSEKLLKTVSLVPNDDGSYTVVMRLVCGGLHKIEVIHDNRAVKNSPFSLQVNGKPERGSRVRKGPDWKDTDLHVQEGIIQSMGVNREYYTYQSTTSVQIRWDGVDRVCQYTWEKHEIELV